MQSDTAEQDLSNATHNEDKELKVTEFLKRSYHKQSKKSNEICEQQILEIEQQIDSLDLSIEDEQNLMEQLVDKISVLEEKKQQANDSILDVAILDALQFVGLDSDIGSVSMTSLTSGLRKRVSLAVLLLGEVDLILLDEPTKGLDIEGLLMLRELMEACSVKSTILMVSHDRDLIDDVATDVIDIFDDKLLYYPGGYTEYALYRQNIEVHHVRELIALDMLNKVEIC